MYYVNVSKIRGTQKRMVYNGNPSKMDDLGVPFFLETPIYVCLDLLKMLGQK